MEKNEIKKALYKEKPTAHYLHHDRSGSGKLDVDGNRIDDRIFSYETRLQNGDKIYFDVPRYEMGEKEFELNLPAQLLIRWLC